MRSTAAVRSAERRVDLIHSTACRLPTKTALWFMKQELAEAEHAYFLTGDKYDLELVRALERSLFPANAVDFTAFVNEEDRARERA